MIYDWNDSNLRASHILLQTVFHVGIRATDCKLRFFQDADFAGNLPDSKSTSEFFWNAYVCADFMGSSKSKLLHPIAAQQLKVCCLMQSYAWRAFQQGNCKTQAMIFCTCQLVVTPSLFNKHTKTPSQRASIQHANGMILLRRYRCCSKAHKQKQKSHNASHIAHTSCQSGLATIWIQWFR